MTDQPPLPLPNVAPDRRIEVACACRLHFGLLSFGRSSGRQFGGAGVMVDGPAVRLSVTAADRLQTAGPLADRARDFACRWAEYAGFPADPSSALACRIEIQSAAPEHSGLGVGTQLALSVAAALTAWFGGRPCRRPNWLKASDAAGGRPSARTGSPRAG